MMNYSLKIRLLYGFLVFIPGTLVPSLHAAALSSQAALASAQQPEMAFAAPASFFSGNQYPNKKIAPNTPAVVTPVSTLEHSSSSSSTNHPTKDDAKEEKWNSQNTSSTASSSSSTLKSNNEADSPQKIYEQVIAIASIMPSIPKEEKNSSSTTIISTNNSHTSDVNADDDWDLVDDEPDLIEKTSTELIAFYQQQLRAAKDDITIRHVHAAFYGLFSKIPSQPGVKPILDVLSNPHNPWMIGQNIMNSLRMATDTKYPAIKHRYLPDYDTGIQNLVALQWYWYSQAAMQNKTYTEVSFQIAGSAVKYLYQFLCDLKTLQEQARSEARSTPTDQARVSSHVKNATAPEYGIDIPESKRNLLAFMMPNKKYHCLFKLMSSNLLFVKPEDHGTTNKKDTALHALGFVESLARKFHGGNEEDGFYKERVPTKVTKLLRNFLTIALKDHAPAGIVARVSDWAIGNTKEALISEYCKKAIICTIPETVEFVTQLYKTDNNIGFNSAITDASFNNTLNALNEELDKYDNRDIRIGNEIIFRI